MSARYIQRILAGGCATAEKPKNGVSVRGGAMKSQPTPIVPFSVVVVLLLSFKSAVWAYRPFVSTDAAVVDVKEMEIELGYFNWAREKRKKHVHRSQGRA